MRAAKIAILCLNVGFATLAHGPAAHGQVPVGEAISLPLSDAAGQDLPLAWLGGLNNPQVSEADMDGDGRSDIIVFDRAGNVVLPFQRLPDQRLAYRHDWKTRFPPSLRGWALWRDYDQDGAADIFTYSSNPGVPGIEVFKGAYVDGLLAFQKVLFAEGPYDILYYPGFSGNLLNLYVTEIDLPAIDDVDGDGDLDIITFNIAGGEAEWYRNTSVEDGHGSDSLRFVYADDCWGRFFESGITELIDLSNNPAACAGDGAQDGHSGPRHAGSTSLTLDVDADGDKDLILGDISFDNLNLLRNGGSASSAWMTSQEPNFPANSISADLHIFPAAFLADTDGDGKRDLLAAPNAEGESLDRRVLWRYRNTGNGGAFLFTYQEDDWLVGDMLDGGSYSAPALMDVDADGAEDLILGIGRRFDPPAATGSGGQLMLLRQNGSASAPAFQIQADDWLGSAAWQAGSLAPAVADVDGDAVPDLLVGLSDGTLVFLKNLAPAGQPAVFDAPLFNFMGIDVGQHAVPAFADLDADGWPELVIGERNGNLNYFPHTGQAATPYASQPTDDFWGGVDVRRDNFPVGHAAPALVQTGGEWRLLCGSLSGQLWLYKNINAQGQPFELLDDDYGQIREGARSRPALAYLSGNDTRYELILGNLRGGLGLFGTDLDATVASLSAAQAELPLRLWPQPAREGFWLESPEAGTLHICDVLGRALWQGQHAGGTQYVGLPSGWPAGTYILHFSQSKGHRQALRLQVGP